MSAPRQFFGSLESLRGLAALGVAVYHVGWTHLFYSSRLIHNGYLLVDFFFVLSGFVICHSYGEKIVGWRQLNRFFWLRLGRLYPLHLLTLLVAVGIEFVKFAAERWGGMTPSVPGFSVSDGHALATNLLLLHSLGLEQSLTFNQPSWSISTEWAAYVTFGVAVLLFGGGRGLLFVAVAAVAGCVALFVHIEAGHLDLTYDYGYFRCILGFFAGVLTYKLYRAAPRADGLGKLAAAWGPVIPLAGVLVLLAFFDKGRSDFVIIPLQVALIWAVVVWPNSVLRGLLSSGPLLWLGKVSYSVYMVHFSLAWLFGQGAKRVLGAPEVPDWEGLGTVFQTSAALGTLLLVGYLAVVLVTSHFTYRWIEDPFRRRARTLWDRWFSTPPRPSSTGGSS